MIFTRQRLIFLLLYCLWGEFEIWIFCFFLGGKQGELCWITKQTTTGYYVELKKNSPKNNQLNFFGIKQVLFDIRLPGGRVSARKGSGCCVLFSPPKATIKLKEENKVEQLKKKGGGNITARGRGNRKKEATKKKITCKEN